jgi:hypothetical protein
MYANSLMAHFAALRFYSFSQIGAHCRLADMDREQLETIGCAVIESAIQVHGL